LVAILPEEVAFDVNLVAIVPEAGALKSSFVAILPEAVALKSSFVATFPETVPPLVVVNILSFRAKLVFIEPRAVDFSPDLVIILFKAIELKSRLIGTKPEAVVLIVGIRNTHILRFR
jgi:hypothetical protein